CVLVKNLDHGASRTCCDFETNATTPLALCSIHQGSNLIRREAHRFTQIRQISIFSETSRSATQMRCVIARAERSARKRQPGAARMYFAHGNECTGDSPA